MKMTMILALALMAPAAFGQTATTAAVRVKKAKKATVVAAAPNQAVASTKILRDEIKRDKGDLSAKVKAERAVHLQLLAQEKAELAQLKGTQGTRAEKKQAHLALRQKYAKMMSEARGQNAFERKNLRQDISSKREQIKKLRQS